MITIGLVLSCGRKNNLVTKFESGGVLLYEFEYVWQL